MVEYGQQTAKKQHALWFAIFFFIPFFGLRMALVNFLGEDEVGVVYIMLIGMMGGVSASIYEVTLRRKRIQAKVWGAVFLLILMSIINFAVFMTID